MKVVNRMLASAVLLCLVGTMPLWAGVNGNGNIALEGSDATAFHQDGNYALQLFTYLQGGSALKVLVLGGVALPLSVSAISEMDINPNPYALSGVSKNYNLANYSAVYIESVGGCYTQADLKMAALPGDEAKIGLARIRAGGGLSVGIENYGGGPAWGPILPAAVNLLPPFDFEGITDYPGAGGGSVCTDGEIFTAFALANGFTQPPVLGCWEHQAYYYPDFQALGFNSLVESDPLGYPTFGPNGSAFLVLGGTLGTPGYLEICKASDPNHPVTGLFTFTATKGGFNSGPISVPVGQCSGSIQVPSGAVTVTETPKLGVAVSSVTAFAYDELGFYHDELISWTQPDLHAIVNVMVGDVDEETLVTFTNYAAPPGLLKLCKIAGDPSTLGQVFTFTVTGGGQRHVYMVTAGPPEQGGNCVLAGNFPVNTPVMIAETPKPPFFPSMITVNEGQLMACTPSSVYCTIATIIPGITQVTFTNTSTVLCDGQNLLTNGSFETGDFTGWTQGGNTGSTNVVSGPYYQYLGAQAGAFYAVLGPVGSPGSLSQRFSTIPGKPYHVCFWLNAVGDNPSFFKGYWDTPQFVSLTNPLTRGWTRYMYGPFTGTGTDTLMFTFRDDPGWIALDNVSVVTP
jgi:hypothetical protein